MVKLSKIIIERLPKLYETNCRNYDNSNRFECLQNCYQGEYMDKINCIPNLNSLYTFKLNQNVQNHFVSYCMEEKRVNISFIKQIFEICRNKVTICNRFGSADYKQCLRECTYH